MDLMEIWIEIEERATYCGKEIGKLFRELRRSDKELADAIHDALVPCESLLEQLQSNMKTWSGVAPADADDLSSRAVRLANFFREVGETSQDELTVSDRSVAQRVPAVLAANPELANVRFALVARVLWQISRIALTCADAIDELADQASAEPEPSPEPGPKPPPEDELKLPPEDKPHEPVVIAAPNALNGIKEAIASQHCAPTVTTTAPAPTMTAVVGGSQVMQVDRAFASILGGTLRPASAGDDPTAISRYVRRLMQRSFVKEKVDNRTEYKLARAVRAGGFAPNAQELHGGHAVVYDFFQKSLPRVEANVRALRAEVCECDEETARLLKDDIVVNLRSLVDEIARPTGPLEAKVELHEDELARLIDELQELLGIDVEVPPQARVELSIGERDANRQALSIVRDFHTQLADKIADLNAAKPRELARVVDALPHSVSEVYAALDCANFQQWDRDAVGDFSVLDWVRDTAAEDWSIRLRDGDAHNRELTSINATSQVMRQELDALRKRLPDYIPIGRQRVERAITELREHLKNVRRLSDPGSAWLDRYRHRLKLLPTTKRDAAEYRPSKSPIGELFGHLMHIASVLERASATSRTPDDAAPYIETLQSIVERIHALFAATDNVDDLRRWADDFFFRGENLATVLESAMDSPETVRWLGDIQQRIEKLGPMIDDSDELSPDERQRYARQAEDLKRRYDRIEKRFENP